uniref:CS domain-containing protein n=1 Tax=Alexandrium monilatum TaxID=311494 RepID=A0A7S4SQE6_9DINO
MARSRAFGGLLAMLLATAAAKAVVPRFKWGQTKELIFLSVMVRDLDESSVSVSLVTEGDLKFAAKNAKGEEHVLNLPLREDVKPEAMKWELSARTDKWGKAVVITLAKKNQHRWDLLAADPKPFKGLMDKDWSREDQSLEPEEESPYVEDNPELVALTEKNLDKTLSKYSAVVVNVRYPWCSQCKSQDDTFAKAAKGAKVKSKKDKSWKKIAFAVVDAREQRKLGRQLGAKCEFTCDYRVYTEKGEDPVTIKSKWSDTELLNDVFKYLRPAVEVVKTPDDVAPLKAKNTTCYGGFASDSDSKYLLFKKVAGLMRGELVFAASFGEERQVEMWPSKQNFSFKYDGAWTDNGTIFFDWVKPRAIPLLQPYDWELRDTYEKLGLPLAKVWIDDSDKNPSFEKVVRHAVRRVAKKYLGKLAFVEQKKSTYSYELRDYGLNHPEAYPAFGIANNASYNSIKYGFEVTPDIAPSVQEFWKNADMVVDKLTVFCDGVLAGTWPVAHETGPAQTNWTTGTVKHVVWKTYKEVTSPEKPLLMQVYGKYRSEHEKKEKEVENLAKVLEPYSESLTVATYDSSDNYVPPEDIQRDKYSSDTEWFWVPKVEGGERPAIKKLMKPKKDAPINTVIEFAKKQSGLDIDVSATMQKFEEQMKENPPPTTTPPPPLPSMGDSGLDMGAGGDMMDSLGGMQEKMEL